VAEPPDSIAAVDAELEALYTMHRVVSSKAIGIEIRATPFEPVPLKDWPRGDLDRLAWLLGERNRLRRRTDDGGDTRNGR